MSTNSLALVAAALLLTGCATSRVRPEAAPKTSPLSTADIIAYTRAGLAEEAILARIRTAGVLPRPTQSGLYSMRQAKVGARVLAAIRTPRDGSGWTQVHIQDLNCLLSPPPAGDWGDCWYGINTYSLSHPFGH